MYFVIYQGDLEKDPLDCGSEYFGDYGGAEDFADRMRNKGLTCTIYSGVAIDEELRDKRYATLEELTALDQEMGLYENPNHS